MSDTANQVDVLSSMYSSIETSPIVNVGVWDESLTVFLRFGHRLFLHMTPHEARALADAFRDRKPDYVRIAISLSLSGYVLVRWHEPERCVLLIGGVASALFDANEAKAIVVALHVAATRAADLIEGKE